MDSKCIPNLWLATLATEMLVCIWEVEEAACRWEEVAEECAAIAAAAEDLVQPAHQDPMESLETQEDRELQASPESLLSPCAHRPLQHHARHARTVSQDLQAHQDPAASQADQDRQDMAAVTHRQDLQAHQDPLETQEDQVNPEAQASRAHQLKANKEELELEGRWEMPVHQDSQEATERPEAPDRQADQDLRDPQDHQATPETTVNQASQAAPVSQEVEVRRESARSTAPSTVECSSRTELAVVKIRGLENSSKCFA
jgi:hypothetical protein